MRIAIMQGRLLPPLDGRTQAFPGADWAAEFPRAAAAGIDAIEWIYDERGATANPIASDAGTADVRRLAAAHGVAVASLCADYFVDRPLLRCERADLEERVRTLRWLIDRCRCAGIGRMVVPFVDASRIDSTADAEFAISALRSALPDARRAGVELHLETNLAPEPFAALLDRLEDDIVRVNYDAGNSASLGFAPADEFAAYGTRVGSVHIKDRVRGGSTVPLGQGNTDFPGLFHALRLVGYRGDFVLQVARGEPCDEVAWGRSNADFVRRNWEDLAR